MIHNSSPQNINQGEQQEQQQHVHTPFGSASAQPPFPPQQQQQIHDGFQSSSYSSQHNIGSSYTSTTSPSNFASYNSPSAQPPPTFQHQNSSFSRSGSFDASQGLPINPFTTGNSFMPQSVSHSSPMGRRSLLTSKLQGQRPSNLNQSSSNLDPSSQQQVGNAAGNNTNFFGSFHDNSISSSYNHTQYLRNQSAHQQQSQPQSQQFGSFHNMPTHVSSSYGQRQDSPQQQQAQQQNGALNMAVSTSSSSYTQTCFGFQIQPAPATATTSKDIAFSTNSSSSTLYQDAQQSVVATPSQTGTSISSNQVPSSSQDHQIQKQATHAPHHHFISSSAPAHSSIAFSSFSSNNRPSIDRFDAQQIQQQSSQPPFVPPEQQQQYNSLSSYRPPGTENETHSAPIPLAEEHLNIAEHPVQDLLLMLSALLQKIVEANDLLHPDHYTSASMHANNHQDSSTPTHATFEQSKYTANVIAFHGRNIPAISLHAYLTRILKYCPVTNEVFLSLLVYFDRIAKRANNGDFNSTFGTTNVGDNNTDNESTSKDPDDEIMTDEAEGDSNGNNGRTGSQQQQLFVMDSYNIHRLIISGITVASKFFSDVFYKNSRYAKVGGLPLEELNHLELQFLSLLDFKLMIQVEEMYRYGDLLLKFWKREQAKIVAAQQQQPQPQPQQQPSSESMNEPANGTQH